MLHSKPVDAQEKMDAHLRLKLGTSFERSRPVERAASLFLPARISTAGSPEDGEAYP